jgi:hypothetical protein
VALRRVYKMRFGTGNGLYNKGFGGTGKTQ